MTATSPAAAFTAQLDGLKDYIFDLYREFHQHPELSMQEHWTVERIEDELRSMGAEPRRFGGTGTVAALKNGDGPVVGYRADIDGLPIAEDTGLDYASTITGTTLDGEESPVMHGCGHDTHITAGLTIAKLLLENTDAWSGTVIMLFQPGEEIAAGAQAMLDDGLWDAIEKPEAIFGQHVWSGPVGSLNLSVGTAMSMADSWKVTLHGKQAHGSQPENSIDPIVLGSYIVTRLQTVVSRSISGNDMAVVTVGSFHSGQKENIIPATAELKINVRTFDEKVRTTVLERIRTIILAEAQASGAPEPTIEEMYRFPRCFNDETLSTELTEVLKATVGADNVNVTPPVTGSEDFGLFGDAIGVPYVYWFFGAYTPEAFARAEEKDGPGALPAGNHSPFFATDDPVTAISTAVTAGLAALLNKVGS